MFFKNIFLILLVNLTLSTLAFQTINSFNDVSQKIDELITNGINSKDIMLVVDLDNTLLKHRQSIGSDQWFSWQEKLLNENESSLQVANSFDELLEIQGLLFALSKMIPTESDLPQRLSKIKNMGVTLVALTSRGYDFRDSTMKHLRLNNFIFSNLGFTESHSHQFLPYIKNEPTSLGFPQNISLDELNSLGINKPPRPVNFSDGVYLSGGQNKGAMIASIIHLTKVNPKYVIFIDDHQKHVERVEIALKLLQIQNQTFRYGLEDENVSNFNQPDSLEKFQSILDWSSLKQVLENIFSFFK